MMSNGKVFCEECRKETAYVETAATLTGRIKDKDYPYAGTVTRCSECGEEVFVSEIADRNLQELYAVYRRENELISLEELRALPKKYAIGKRPLSLLLGWGEQTFSRYADGDIPTRQYSAVLERLCREPAYYATLLEANKGKLRSSLAYEKSRRAVDALLKATFAESKIDNVIKYLLCRCEDITPLALQKALYYIQGFYFAFYKTFLFEEDCEAWIHGPVYRTVYYRYRDYRFDPIAKTENFGGETFPAGEKAIYDSVSDNICCYSGKVLERFTHSETPWLITRGELPLNAPSERIIEKKLIGTYFDSVKEKYKMLGPWDIKSYAQAMFLS